MRDLRSNWVMGIFVKPSEKLKAVFRLQVPKGECVKNIFILDPGLLVAAVWSWRLAVWLEGTQKRWWEEKTETNIDNLKEFVLWNWNMWQLLGDVILIDRVSRGNFYSVMCSDGHERRMDRSLMLAKGQGYESIVSMVTEEEAKVQRGEATLLKTHSWSMDQYSL